jgi:ribonuclease E
LFHRYQVEGQLDAMHSPVVQLKSGGYIVIHATEALVAIDVNSGRATRERNIEETAYRTNVEAADEVALQLRLRDLAGLIVIDFIDMEDSRNTRNVERRFREAVKNDRARIQLGRISTFGLMELSRQRLRPSLLETSGQVCPHCQGTGHVRSVESSAIRVLRRLEEEGIRARSAELAVGVPPTVALYILNQKRQALVEVENRYNFRILIKEDPALIAPDMKIDRLGPRPEVARPIAAPALAPPIDEALEAADEAAAAADALEGASDVTADEFRDDAVVVEPEHQGGDERRGRRRRRRRGRRGGEERDQQPREHAREPQSHGQPSYPQQHISFAAPRLGEAEPHGEGEDGTPAGEPFEVRVEPPQHADHGEQPHYGDGQGQGQGRGDGDGGRRRRRRRGRRGGRGRREDGQPIQPAGFGPQPEGEYGQPYAAAYQPSGLPQDEPEVSVEPPPRPAEPRPPRPPIDVVPPWRKQQQADAQPSPSPQPEARRDMFPQSRHDVTPPAHFEPVPEAHPAPPPVPPPRTETFPAAQPDITPPAHVEPPPAMAPQVEPAPTRPEPPPIVEPPPLPPGERRKGWWSKIAK